MEPWAYPVTFLPAAPNPGRESFGVFQIVRTEIGSKAVPARFESALAPTTTVTRGLDPRVHPLRIEPFCEENGLPGHQGVYARLRGLSPAMTPNWIDPIGIRFSGDIR
jgi:hypothetical protein